MTNKYRLLDKKSDNGLYRIVALRDFAGVKAGDIGGFVESTDNLSQSGDCWVYGNARVYGNAWVFGNAWVHDNANVHDNAEVYGNARVFGKAVVFDSARVYGDARVFGNAKVCDNAEVGGKAWVYDNALVYGNAWVFGNARVFGKARVTGDAKVLGDAKVYGNASAHGHSKFTSKALVFSLERHTVTVCDNQINIGCKGYSSQYWLDNYWQIGRASGYSDEDIEIYGDLLKFINKHWDIS